METLSISCCDHEAEIEHYRSLETIRAVSANIYQSCVDGRGVHFTVDESRIATVADVVISLINRDYGGNIAKIPFHSRWRHFEAGGIDRIQQIRQTWGDLDDGEVCRRLLDLVFVSVLLDAGAGSKWKYHEAESNQFFSRSEGLGVASFHLFEAGGFSSLSSRPHQVDSIGLKQMTNNAIAVAFQVDDTSNPMIGAVGRSLLMQQLGAALERTPQVFEKDGIYRPGHLYDHLLSHSSSSREIDMSVIWHALQIGLYHMWSDISNSDRACIHGTCLGDVWMYNRSILVPFHKLTQWLAYSLLEPISTSGNLLITNTQLLTGLPEYRNGGLLVDHQVIRLKDGGNVCLGGRYLPSSDVIIEWRALTVILLDKIAAHVRSVLNLSVVEFPLAKMLEAGTWKAGRIIARELRGEEARPPIEIESDGTVF